MMKFSQRTLSRGRSAIFAPLTAAFVLLPAGLAGAANTPTKLLNGNGRFLVRPSQVGLPLREVNGDGFVLAGRQRPKFRSHNWRFGTMHWAFWGGSRAYGVATEWLGPPQEYSPRRSPRNPWQDVGAVRVHAWRPVSHRFSRLTVNGGRIHRTWKLGRCSPFPGGRYTYLWEPFLCD